MCYADSFGLSKSSKQKLREDALINLGAAFGHEELCTRIAVANTLFNWHYLWRNLKCL